MTGSSRGISSLNSPGPWLIKHTSLYGTQKASGVKDFKLFVVSDVNRILCFIMLIILAISIKLIK
jgi:hypothetical protein